MKHYEIIVSNGDYPLRYRCSTTAEAYGCIDTLRTGLLHDRRLSMEELMEALVEMKRGELLSHAIVGLSINVREGAS